MGKKLNNEIFISRSKEIHKNKYDYSLVNYKNCKTKIKIICPRHGIFEQMPQNHLKGSGCLSCFNEDQTSNAQEFIKKSNIIHKNKYDYSEVIYKNNLTKVKIKCQKHGDFHMRPGDHLDGSGCRLCGIDKKRNFQEYIIKSKKIHNNKYDYSKANYKSNNSKITIICPLHGDFKQTPKLHLKGSGCPSCDSNLNLDTKSFINKSKIIHKNKYDYTDVNYIKNNIKVKIKCPKHGIFEQKPMLHLAGQGCPICKSSKGEKKISNFLEKNNINYISQFSFDNCKYILSLPFDFYLTDLNICIEYDGIQHFKEVEYWGGKDGLTLRKLRDDIKTTFCKNNCIKLIRIAYYENNIDEKLTKELCMI